MFEIEISGNGDWEESSSVQGNLVGALLLVFFWAEGGVGSNCAIAAGYLSLKVKVSVTKGEDSTTNPPVTGI